MNDQLGVGIVLLAAAGGSAAAGFHWLALAALAASLPFLAAGVAFAVGGMRAARDRAARLLR